MWKAHTLTHTHTYLCPHTLRWGGWRCFIPCSNCIISPTTDANAPGEGSSKRGNGVFLASFLRSSLFLFRLFKAQQLHTYHPTKSISPSLSPTTSLLFIYNIKRFTSLNYLFFALPSSILFSLSLIALLVAFSWNMFSETKGHGLMGG